METLIDYTSSFAEVNNLLGQLITLQAKSNVYSEWIFGIEVAIFIISIVLIFAIFFSNTR